MPTTDRPTRRDQQRSGTGTAAAGIGAALLAIVCCAGPALIASGTLGALGAFLGNPWVIAAAVLLLAGAVTAARAAAPAAHPPRAKVRTADDLIPARPAEGLSRSPSPHRPR